MIHGPSVNAAAIVDAATRIGSRTTRNRLVLKLSASNAELTAVAYWGGTLTVFDRSGAAKASRRFPQDITALQCSDTALIIGDADGRIIRLKAP